MNPNPNVLNFAEPATWVIAAIVVLPFALILLLPWCKPAKRKVFVIEANISAGKSTVLKGLRLNGFNVVEEPLDKWQNEYVDDANGQNILGYFYEDMARWSFQFEVMAMVTRWKNLKKALAAGDEYIIVERSLYTDRMVFAPNLRETGVMNAMEWKIYVEWYETFMAEIEDVLDTCDFRFLYINTDPVTCHERKTKRARTEEGNMVPGYLQQLHDKHQNWLLDRAMVKNTIIVDGHLTEDVVLRQVLDAIRSNL
jgi:deoxycitidine kinase